MRLNRSPKIPQDGPGSIQSQLFNCKIAEPQVLQSGLLRRFHNPSRRARTRTAPFELPGKSCTSRRSSKIFRCRHGVQCPGCTLTPRLKGARGGTNSKSDSLYSARSPTGDHSKSLGRSAACAEGCLRHSNLLLGIWPHRRIERAGLPPRSATK